MAAKTSRQRRKPQFDVVVLGGINLDYLVRGKTLPQPGDTVDGAEFLRAGGGKGANQAVAAARLGARVAFIGRVGRDEHGDELLGLLADEGIDVRFTTRDPQASTGVALVMIDCAGEKQIMVAPGANHRLSPREITAAKDLVAGARVLLTQFEIPMRSVLAAVRIAHGAGVKIVIDPAPPQRAPRELVRRATIIRPNSAEAQALTGVKVSDLPSARKAARKLLSFGVTAAATQAGDAGDLLVWKDGEACFPRLPVKVVDATGAGDAFAAGLAVALSEGRSWMEAGAFANAAAALATTKFGAQPAMPRRNDVLRLMRKHKHTAEAAAFTRRRKATRS
jgi:ribokinase